MAQGISYSIAGKYNPKGEKQAISGISKITKAAKAFNLAVGGFVITKVFQGINKVVSGSTEEFNKNNKALANFNKSIANNAKLAEGAVGRLQQSMDKFSAKGLFGGDELNNAAALASQMQLTEEQITNVMDAATEMAASGVMPLDAAIKNLSKSFSGEVGELGDLAPALKNLTKEQLENGEAVKILKENYDGFRDSMSNTFSGKDKQFEDAFGHLQESIGGIFQGLKFGGEDLLLKPLHTVADFLEKNKIKILKFVYNLPDIIKVVASSAWDYIKETFTSDGLKNLFEHVAKAFIISIKGALLAMRDMAKALIQSVIDFLDWLIGNNIRKLQDKLGELGNNIITKLNKMILDFLEQHEWAQNMYKKKTGQYWWTAGIKTTFDTNNAEKNKTWDETISKIGTQISDAAKSYKKYITESWAQEKENFEDFAQFYDEITKNASEELKEAINKELPEELRAAIEAGADESGTGAGEANNIIVVGNSNVENNNTEETATGTQAFKKNLSSIIGAFGEVGQMINSIIEVVVGSAGPWGIIIQLIIQFISALSQASQVFNTVINFIGKVMAQAAGMVAPIIDKMLMPFLNCLYSLGVMVGRFLIPVFLQVAKITEPIVKLFAEIVVIFMPMISIFSQLISILIECNPIFEIFNAALKTIGSVITWLYNTIVVPIANSIIWLFTQVGNGFIGMYNGVAGVLNSISIFGHSLFSIGYKDYLSYDDRKLNKIDYDVYDEGDRRGSQFVDNNKNTSPDYSLPDYSLPDYIFNNADIPNFNISSDINNQSTSQNSGHAASYTAPRNIIMNIDVGNVVGQDGMREFALMIRQEIKEAEALGR